MYLWIFAGVLALAFGAASASVAYAQGNAEGVSENASPQTSPQARAVLNDRLELMREATTTPARSIIQLKQTMENRKMEVWAEAESTGTEVRKVLEGVAPYKEIKKLPVTPHLLEVCEGECLLWANDGDATHIFFNTPRSLFRMKGCIFLLETGNHT